MSMKNSDYYGYPIGSYQSTRVGTLAMGIFYPLILIPLIRWALPVVMGYPGTNWAELQLLVGTVMLVMYTGLKLMQWESKNPN